MAKATEKSKIGQITIATVRNREAARWITTKLESAGIECSLIDERGSTVGGMGRLRLGGIKVQVERADVTRAVQLLKEKADEDISLLHESGSVQRVVRVRLGIEGWKRHASEIIVIVVLAAILAAWLF